VYGRFVGQRFKDLPNIVWMLGGDYTPNKADQWTVTDLASAIREQDPTHLMTAITHRRVPPSMHLGSKTGSM